MLCGHGFWLADCAVCAKHPGECDYGSCTAPATGCVGMRPMCDRHSAVVSVRDAAVAAHPVGSIVATLVQSVTGGERVTGTVVDHRSGRLVMATACHGRLIVAPADLVTA